MNMLAPGQGGSPTGSEIKTNGLAVKAQPRNQSAMMKHFGTHLDGQRDRFEKMKEAKSQIDAVVQEFGKLAQLGDTVDSKDVVKGCAGIVAAGVPAVQMASILADMPEKGQALQDWVKDELQKAQSAEQQIDHGLSITRHGVLTAALQHLVAHSAESQQLAQAVPAGSA